MFARQNTHKVLLQIKLPKSNSSTQGYAEKKWKRSRKSDKHRKFQVSKYMYIQFYGGQHYSHLPYLCRIWPSNEFLDFKHEFNFPVGPTIKFSHEMSKVRNMATNGTETTGLPESVVMPIQDTAMPSTS